MEGGAALEREKQMMSQLQTGLSAISEIVKQVKEQSSQQIKEVTSSTFDGMQESV